jgi:hypothetical protein
MVANIAYQSRPAERVLLRERFENPAKVHANGWTLTGGCVPDNGLPLDGSTQYATRALAATELTRGEISIVVEFTPDDNYDVDKSFFLFDTTGGHRYLVEKLNNASANSLELYLGDTSIASINTSKYSAYWKQGERNRLIISAEDGATNAWLNGENILLNDLTSWSPAYPTTLRVGEWAGGTGYAFAGTMHGIDFREGLLTQADVDAIEDGSLFTYQNRANLWLDMKEQTRRVGTLRGVVQLLTDGDMEAVGVGSWNNNNATPTKETGDPVAGSQFLRVTGTGVNAYAWQAPVTVGKRYRARGYARGDATASPGVRNFVTLLWTGTADANWQVFDRVFIGAGGAAFNLLSTDGQHCDYDEIEVFETDEIISDGEMAETGVTAWLASTATLTKSEASGLRALRVSTTASEGRAYQNILTIGKRYMITGQARGDGSRAPRISENGYIWFGTTSTDWQDFAVEHVATGAALELWSVSVATGWTEWRNVSVKEMPDVTLDKSPNGHVVMLGDGHTASTQPTFLSPGYEYDGGDYCDGFAIFPVGTTDFTLWAVVKLADYAANHSILSVEEADLSPINALLFVNSGGYPQYYHGGSSGPNASSAPAGLVRPGEKVVLIGTGDGSATYLYVNGVQMPAAATPAEAATTADSRLWIGKRGSGINLARAGTQILACGSFPRVLSPIQARDHSISLGVNA